MDSDKYEVRKTIRRVKNSPILLAVSEMFCIFALRKDNY